MKTSLILFTLLTLFSVANARLNKPLDHQKLIKKSDAIVILKPIKAVKSNIPYPGNSHGDKTDNIQGWITTFKVIAVYKGDIEKKQQLKILHYTYANRFTEEFNGSPYWKFPIEPVERKVSLLRDGKQINEYHDPKYIPHWLSYLKKRKDGLYEPVTEVHNIQYSFFEIPLRYK